MAIFDLSVDRDHITSLSKGSPTLAIAELLWNAWDADAENIAVKITRTDLSGIDKITVTDDGNGLEGKDPELLFTKIGGSWKNIAKRTPSGRLLHGERGRGRLKALSIGDQITWKIPDKSTNKLHTILFNAGSINKIDLSSIDIDKIADQKSIVEITEIGDRAGELLCRDKVESVLAIHFALSIKNHPKVIIKFDGKRIDPSVLIDETTVISLPIIHEGRAYNPVLEIIHWKHKTDRKLYICDSKGRILQETDVKLKPGSGFNFCAYIKSDEFLESIGESNDIIISGGLCEKILEEARSQMRIHFRGKKALVASGLVKAWKEEGIYPFEDESTDPAELVKRQVFDICAYNINEYLDGFSSHDTQSRQLTFYMLSEAINEHPSALKRIFEKILKIPKDKLEDLADIFDQVDIGRVLEATQMSLERLSFLDGLNALIFNKENSKLLGEKHHLHAMLEREPWVFGEEYSLAASEVTLTTLLKRHLPKLRPDEKIVEVKSTTGKALRIDMLLGCEIGTGSKEFKEFIVVELKRPSVVISLKEQNQIMEYAHAVSEDPQFDKKNTKWTFILVSKDLHPIIERSVNQEHLPSGYFQVDSNLKIGAMTWGQIITRSRSRLQWYRDAVNFDLNESQALDYMRKKHGEYLPVALKQAPQ